MRQSLFKKLSDLSTTHPWRVLLLSLAITVVAGWLASKLRLEMTWVGLVPKNEPVAVNFEKLIKEFGSEGGLLIAVEHDDPDSLIVLGNEVADSIAKLKKLGYVRAVTFEEPEDYLAHHAFMLIDTSMIGRVETLFTSANIDTFLLNFNNDLESEYIESQDNLSAQELEATMSLMTIEDLLIGMDRYLGNGDTLLLDIGSKEAVVGPLIFRSLDGKMSVISVAPAMSAMDMDRLLPFVDSVRTIISRIQSRHSGLKLNDTGIYSIGYDEYQTGIRDSTVTTIASFILVILLFVIGFRALQAPILVGIPLTFGIVWDLGLTYLLIGRLNLMTALVAAILIGLGIDYSIHILQAASEKEGIAAALTKVGNGIVTGAVTTAAAFLSLYLTSFDVLRELGIVVGVGVLTTAGATIILLPALLKLFGRRIEKRDFSAHSLGLYAQKVRSLGMIVPAALLILLIISPIAIRKIKVTYNPIELEADGLKSVETQNEVTKRFGMSTDYISILTTSIDESYSVAKSVKKLPGVSFAEGIHLYLPPPELQDFKMPYLERIHARASKFRAGRVNRQLLLDQLDRLQDNIVELKTMAYMAGLDRVYAKCENILKSGIFDDLRGKLENVDGNRLNGLNNRFFSIVAPLVRTASTPEKITLDDVPEVVRDRFISKDNRTFLVNVFTRSDIWQGVGRKGMFDRFMAFKGATGTPLLMHVLWEAGKRESFKALTIVFIVIFLILLLDFRSLRHSIIAYLPVTFAFVYSLAIMGLLKVNLNFMNVLALPLIIGIGIDDAVHIVHRYIALGDVNTVFTRIGRAILYTSLTTMAAFGSLFLGRYKGYPSFGAVVVIGVGTAFIVTVTLLPPLLKWVKRKQNEE